MFEFFKKVIFEEQRDEKSTGTYVIEVAELNLPCPQRPWDQLIEAIGTSVKLKSQSSHLMSNASTTSWSSGGRSAAAADDASEQNQKHSFPGIAPVRREERESERQRLWTRTDPFKLSAAGGQFCKFRESVIAAVSQAMAANWPPPRMVSVI